MRSGRRLAFTGAMAALAAMSTIAVAIGRLVKYIPKLPALHGVKVDQWVAVVAFSFFGLKLLFDSYLMTEVSGDLKDGMLEADKEVSEAAERSKLGLLAQAFSLVFAAEVGDRSFLATIALSTAFSPLAVVAGAVAGHSLAMGLAVISGSWLSRYLSEKVIGYIGGSLFLIFAFTTAVGL